MNENELKNLFSAIIDILVINEKILKDYALSFDYLNPSNLLKIKSSDDKIVLAMIDTELLTPNTEALRYFKEKNINIPNLPYSDFTKAYLPTVPEFPILSNVWNLDLKKSILFYKLLYLRTHLRMLSTNEALQEISTLPKYTFPFEGILTLKNVIEAQKNCNIFFENDS